MTLLYCSWEKKIVFIFFYKTNPCKNGSTFRKQSRLTTYCRHCATIRYVYTRTHSRDTGISDFVEIESATVGEIRKRKRERESMVHLSPMCDTSLRRDNIISFDKLARIIGEREKRSPVFASTSLKFDLKHFR